MNNFIISPVISLNAFDTKTLKGKTAKVEGRMFYSLSYRKHGAVNINVGKKHLISKADSITFIPKKQAYTTSVIEDTHLTAIHFDCVDKNICTEAFVLDNCPKQFQHLFETVYNTYTSDKSCNYECYSLLYKLLSEIEKHLAVNSDIKTNPYVAQAKSMIEKNFSDNNFNIDLLISNLPIGSSYLRSEFKKAYSVTPIEYLKNIRHQNALSLLSSDYYTVEDIAGMCGYSSSSYFIQVFRKTTGLSPLKYKQNFFRK
jgi:AraC-like DNA-binding protein